MRQALSPRSQRVLILGILVALAALCWLIVIRQALSMSGMNSAGGMGGATMGLTMGMGAALFLGVWAAMMMAMMLPSAAPMLLMFNTIAAGKRRSGQAFTPTWIFLAGYLLVWTLTGVVAYVVALALDAVAAHSMLLMTNAGRIGGALLLLAGIYQLTPLKHICLAKCRTPVQFVLTSWRNGAGGALRMGVEHGLYCLGCCWLLFVILFPLGMMNIAALALLTALIFAEKALPIGRSVSVALAVALIVYGALAIVSPGLLPGTMA